MFISLAGRDVRQGHAASQVSLLARPEPGWHRRSNVGKYTRWCNWREINTNHDGILRQILIPHNQQLRKLRTQSAISDPAICTLYFISEQKGNISSNSQLWGPVPGPTNQSRRKFPSVYFSTCLEVDKTHK